MKIDRLIAIIMALLNYDKITATQLAKMFEVTPRTIYRDIDTIGKAGIPIVTTPGVDGGISILPSYKVDKQFFSSEDIQSLLMGLSSIKTTLPQSELIAVKEKLKTLIPTEQTKDILLKSEQITIDLTTWMGNKKFLVTLEKVNFPFVPDELGYNLLLSFGDKCECLGPESIRESFAQHIYHLYQIYNPNKNSL